MKHAIVPTQAPKFSMMVGSQSLETGVKLTVEGNGRIDFSPVVSQVPTSNNGLQSTAYWSECEPSTYLLSLGQYSCTPCGIIKFHEGNIDEPNGTTVESLLHVVEHRLEHHQSGEYPCKENAAALSAVRAALVALHHRSEKQGKVS